MIWEGADRYLTVTSGLINGETDTQRNIVTQLTKTTMKININNKVENQVEAQNYDNSNNDSSFGLSGYP